MSIIDNDYQTLTILDQNKKVIIRNINEYNIMKYEDFKGKQIKKTLNKYCKVEETFNDGVFNVFLKGHKLQSHNKIEICKRLKFCIDNDTIDPIVELFESEIKEELNQMFFDQVLEPFMNRIKITEEKEIIIDDIFKIDMNGQAYFKNANKKFMSLCIVAGSQEFKHAITHALGKFKVDFRTIEIYYKILFLLYPNKSDRVFYNQLPKHIKEVLN
jgi:hypothetical protein